MYRFYRETFKTATSNPKVAKRAMTMPLSNPALQGHKMYFRYMVWILSECIVISLLIWSFRNTIYFIPSSEFNAYLKQIKVILSAVKKYRIFSLVTNTIYIFSL